jgi:pilus assembly protein FimV
MAFNKAKAMQEAEKFVSQGKLSQAIRQYERILEKEPSDLILLNTVGDLYVREKNLPEALRNFHKLADSYSQEGFTLKAIAIYKKISKLDSNAIDVLVKTGDLYVLQGLAREARDQFVQAVDAFRKKNQNDKAMEAFRKIIALDPENLGYRNKLADFCAQVGKKAEAAKAYAELAELAFRRGDAATTDGALSKAVSLDEKNAPAQLLRARLALGKNQPREAEKILNSIPDLASNPVGRQVLLEAYLAEKKLPEAEKLVTEVFRANPTDFSPVASYANLCLANKDFDSTLAALTAVADPVIQMKDAGPLMEILRKMWQEDPRHIPTLELAYKVCDKTADEAAIPEVLEALGAAYLEKPDLEKAEQAYQSLVNREPENANYKALLKKVLEKQGKAVETKPEELAAAEVALTPQGAEAEALVAPPAGAPSAEEAAMVREALENSDLFSRYGLAEKATVELEKVLAVYPDQVDIHRRILEVCQKNLPDRAKQAAEALARIHAARGETELAEKYQLTATRGAPPPVVEPSVPFEAPPPAAPAPEAPVAEFDISSGIPGFATEEPAGPQEIPLDLTPPAAPPEATAPSVQEFDLSAGFESVTGPPEPEAPPPTELVPDVLAPAEPARAAEEAPPFNYEDSRIEVEFYLSQGFAEEAEKSVAALEERFPESPKVAELRRLVEERAGRMPVPGETVPAPEVAMEEAGVEAAPEAAPEAAAEAEPEPAAEPVPEPVAEPEAAAPPTEEWELPSAPLGEVETVPAEFPTAAGPSAPPSPPEPVLGTSTPVEEPTPEAGPVAPAGADLLGSLVGDLAASLEGIEEQAPPGIAASGQPAPPTPASGDAPSPLSGLLEELGEEPSAQAGGDDPQTHYDLGVAFREMSLLDEAIGEFQKVVKGAQKGKYPANYLQACTLLATCFMDKQMPAIAAKWYARALETPSLDDEALMALEYDMGVAYEMAGDKKTALEKFSEVYSQNIDYRDVAEKIRQLQQKN